MLVIRAVLKYVKNVDAHFSDAPLALLPYALRVRYGQAPDSRVVICTDHHVSAGSDHRHSFDSPYASTASRCRSAFRRSRRSPMLFASLATPHARERVARLMPALSFLAFRRRQWLVHGGIWRSGRRLLSWTATSVTFASFHPPHQSSSLFSFASLLVS